MSAPGQGHPPTPRISDYIEPLNDYARAQRRSEVREALASAGVRHCFGMASGSAMAWFLEHGHHGFAVVAGYLCALCLISAARQ